ncbi:hypothetical protein QCA50_006657 [Cerrena zonata]|uniref:SHSP domain-containing protein n=1 Tax=Cerrena zonata TaxID=2478898 RepID=A0AAW0G9E5_9APHY
MSLARQFLREFRPLFRMLEEPLGVSPRYGRSSSFFDDPFFHSPRALRPAIDVTEEGNRYIVEAELPGVKKDDIEVRIGDGGRSLTIEGKIAERNSSQVPQAQVNEGAASIAEGTSSTAVSTPESTQITSEREFVANTTFTRTVYLPRPVKSDDVVAKLNDGILTVSVPKAEDVGSVKITVE